MRISVLITSRLQSHHQLILMIKSNPLVFQAKVSTNVALFIHENILYISCMCTNNQIAG